MSPWALLGELVLVPAICAAIPARLGARFAGLGVALGVSLAYAALHGGLRWPPSDAASWLVPTVVVSALLNLAPCTPLVRLLRAPVIAVLVGLAVPAWASRQPGLAALVLGGIGGFTAILWSALERTERPGRAAAAAVLALALAAFAQGYASSARLAMLTAALAAGLAGAMGAARPERRAEALSAALGPTLAAAALLLTTGVVFGELPALVPLALGVALAASARRLHAP